MNIQPFQTERFFAKHEFSAPYLLCSSDCESLTIAELLEMGNFHPDSLATLRLGYTESQGSPTLRKRIASQYRNIKPDQVIGLAAPEEGVFLTMHSLLEAGDHVVVLTPCYNSLLNIAEHIGCRVTEWSLQETHDPAGGFGKWQLGLDRLRQLVSARTKLVILNFPNNPTGYLPSAAEWQEIVDIVARQRAWLFSDEMYRGLEYRKDAILQAGCDLYDRAISLAGLSKVHGLPGLRVGWLALQDETLREQISTWKDYTTICSSAPSELLGEIALSIEDKLIERSQSIIRTNLATANSFFQRWDSFFQWNQPQAGSVAFARIRNGSAKEFAEQLLAEQGVLLLPSSVFRFGDQHLRFGFGRVNFPEGLGRLGQYMERRYSGDPGTG